MKKFKVWLSSVFYRMCLPYLEREVAALVSWELERHHRLTADVRAFILEDLEKRVPREGTTHALACHVRDQTKELDRRLSTLEKIDRDAWTSDAARRLYASKPVRG